jgi:transposase
MPPLTELPAAYVAIEKERDELRAQVADLRRQLEWLRKQVFGGAKSETYEKQQLLLKIGEEEEQMAKQAEAEKRQVSYERRVAEKKAEAVNPYEKLPVKETVIIEPKEVKEEPEKWERIGEEKNYEVEITPPQMWKREIIRPKYRKVDDRERAPVVAPAPARPVPGGHASAGLLAWVSVSKYLDHIPLFRQEKMFARQGVAIPGACLCDWIRITAEWLEPVYRKMYEKLWAGNYLQADETPLACADPDAGKGTTSRGYMWLISCPGGDVVFDWRLSRRHAELTSLVKGFKAGVLQSDGYAAYLEYAKEHPELAHVGCWTHARRRFVEAQAEAPKAVRVVLKLIGRLYRLEREWDHADAEARRERDPPERSRLRQLHFARSLKWLHALAVSLRSQHRPRSGVGEASGYLRDVLTRLPSMTNHDDLTPLLPSRWAKPPAPAAQTP